MNERELASFILLGVFVLLILMIRQARRPLGSVLALLFSPKLGIPLLLFAGWTTLAVAAAHAIGLWSADLVGGTVLWFLLVGLAWFMNLTDTGKDHDFFKRRIIAAIGIGAFVEFFVNLEVMALPLELLLQVLLLVVATLDVVARSKAEFKPVARLTNALLAFGGLSLLVYTIYRLVSDWDSLILPDVVNQLLLPIWLTIAAIPYLYILALIMGYESLITNMTFWNDKRRPSWRVIAGTAVELKGRLVDVSQFQGMAAKQAVHAGTLSGARQAVRDFKRKRAADQAARAAARQRLVDFAGVEGVDADGLRLDRREFKETKAALRWLATCHPSWYRRDDRPDKYRSDLLTMLTTAGFSDLPDDHGIKMKVRKDGKAWYAYRVTPSGYIFGVGADGPPPSEWYYDGERPPATFPSRKTGWTSFMDPDRPEWREESQT